VSKYYIKYTDIKTIYDFLCDLFNNKKDTLDKKDDNKIVLNVTFPYRLKKENIIKVNNTSQLKFISSNIFIINLLL